MAGAFTHMAVVFEAKKSFQPQSDFGKIIREYHNFLTLGSVSPDIPYLAYLSTDNEEKSFDWANFMHYHQTSRIVSNTIHSLSVVDRKTQLWKAQLAWVLGYTSHLVTDATIHPIVESIVGPYTKTESRNEHRICEMVQDVMIHKEVLNLELNESEYTNILRAAIDNPKFEKVIEFWANHAEVNFPFNGKFPAKEVVKSYTHILDTAEGGNALANLFRHIGSTFTYKTYLELKKNHKDWIKKYYEEIILPNGLTGNFKRDGFEYATKNLVSVWSQIERSLFTTSNIVNIVPNWNLDTGVDQDTNVRTYWS